MKGLFFLLTALNLAFCASAQQFEIYCAQVGEEGSVTLNFQQPSIGAIDRYVIEIYDEGAGIYQTVGTIADGSQTTYTDAAHDANTASLKYRIRAEFSSSQSLEASIQTIHLIATENQNNTINLSWTDLSNSMPQEDQGNPYKIYRKRIVAATDWELVAEQTANQYTDILPQICNDTIYYKIELENQSGCVSRSNQAKIEVSDSEIPQEPILLSSSVDLASQKLTLNWTPSSSDDVYGYVICAGSPCVAIDTVWGADAATYVCDDCDVEIQNSLAVMAFDSCYNTSLRTERHTNMVLSGERQGCDSVLSLTWTPYQDFDSGLQSYGVYMQEGENEIYNRILTTQNTSCEVSVSANVSFCRLYIAALAQDGTVAQSNALTIDVKAAREVEFIEIRRVSVGADNSEVELDFWVDASLAVDGYRLERSKDGEAYCVIATLPYEGTNALSYTDIVPISADQCQYSYILSAPDECGLRYKSSKAVSPIFLSAEQSDENAVLVRWTPFSGWQNGVSIYEVFRFSPSEGIEEFLLSTSATSCTDNSTPSLASDNRTCYFVRAKENGTGADNVSQTANSNYACSIHESIFYIPNAFTPREETNNIFKPQCHFIEPKSYSMRIFNRWGECLFSTNDPSVGWDGRFKEEFCHLGTYIYVIEFINSQGEKTTRKGTVAIVE